MAGPPIEDRKIYLDRYTTSGGGWSVDLAALMVPSDATQPSAMAITAGNSAGHFTVASGVLSVSATGDSADLSAGTYTFTVQGTWSAFGSATNTATLTIVCPPASIYVDPATGNDANPGTKASPLARSPEDPLFTGTFSNPASLTLCVHKDGSLIRSRLVKAYSNLINASICGWGAGTSITTYNGADLCPTSTTPSSGDVFANPNIANIKKFSFATARSQGQNLIDRDNDSLLHWAQWPAAGADPFLDAYDPGRHLTGGMYQCPASTFSMSGATSTCTLPADAVTEFGSKDLTGCLLGIWVTSNFVNWFEVTAYNTTTHVATFNFTGTLQTSTGTPTTGTTAFQIVGHPFSIKAAGQFAWSADRKDIFGWFTVGTTCEILTRKQGYDTYGGTVHGLGFEGYYGNTDNEGCGIAFSNSSSFSFEVLRCRTRWLVSYGGTGAAARFDGAGTITSGLVEGNTFIDGVRTAAMRVGNYNFTHVTIASNVFRRFSATAAYLGACSNLIFEKNLIEDILGVHANGLSIYIVGAHYPSDNTIRKNTFRNVVRPLTLNAQPNLVVSDNIIEMDGAIRDGVRVYSADSTLAMTRNIFARRRNIAGLGDDALSAGGSPTSPIVGTYTGNIIDGLLGGVEATFINNLITQHATNENDVTLNVSPDTGNTYEARLWDGTISPSWKQRLGVGQIGREGLVYGLAVVSFTSVINQNISTSVQSNWSLMTSDGTRPISVTNGEYNIANDASGTGAVGWSSSASTVANGKYVSVRTTTTSTYETDKTVTLDLGDGNIFTWTARTKQAAGFPLVAVDTSDNWKPTNLQIAAAGTKTCTFAFFGRIDAGTAFNTIFGHYAGGTAERIKIECLGSGNGYRLRIKLQNSTPSIIAEFQSPSMASYIGQLITLIITVDLAQASSSAGVKVYVNGASAGSLFSTTTWTQNGTIDWTYTSSQFTFANLNFVGLVGMVYLNTTWVDVTDATVRDKFTPLRIGTDGSNATGVQPPVFLVGTDATTTDNWMSASGINRGTGAKLIKQGSTSVTLDSGGASSWPAFTYAAALTSLAGSASPVVGQTRTYTGTLNGALLNPITINLSDGASGTFTPSSISLNPTTGPQNFSFTYQPASAGAKTITASASGLTSATLGVTAQPAVATAYTLTGAASANVGDPITLTLTLNGANPNGASFAFALSGITGVFSDNPEVVSAGASVGTLTFTPTSPGVAVITPTNTEGLTNPAAKSITVAAAPSTGGPPSSRLRLGLGLGLL